MILGTFVFGVSQASATMIAEQNPDLISAFNSTSSASSPTSSSFNSKKIQISALRVRVLDFRDFKVLTRRQQVRYIEALRYGVLEAELAQAKKMSSKNDSLGKSSSFVSFVERILSKPRVWTELAPLINAVHADFDTKAAQAADANFDCFYAGWPGVQSNGICHPKTFGTTGLNPNYVLCNPLIYGDLSVRRGNDQTETNLGCEAKAKDVNAVVTRILGNKDDNSEKAKVARAKSAQDWTALNNQIQEICKTSTNASCGPISKRLDSFHALIDPSWSPPITPPIPDTAPKINVAAANTTVNPAHAPIPLSAPAPAPGSKAPVNPEVRGGSPAGAAGNPSSVSPVPARRPARSAARTRPAAGVQPPAARPAPAGLDEQLPAGAGKAMARNDLGMAADGRCVPNLLIQELTLPCDKRGNAPIHPEVCDKSNDANLVMDFPDAQEMFCANPPKIIESKIGESRNHIAQVLKNVNLLSQKDQGYYRDFIGGLQSNFEACVELSRQRFAQKFPLPPRTGEKLKVELHGNLMIVTSKWGEEYNTNTNYLQATLDQLGDMHDRRVHPELYADEGKPNFVPPPHKPGGQICDVVLSGSKSATSSFLAPGEPQLSPQEINAIWQEKLQHRGSQ